MLREILEQPAVIRATCLGPLPEPLLCPFAVIRLQLLASSMAVARGIDVDRQRNLTKAVHIG
jgi:glucosamine 6-phosphate synthetase-like amidotransferase/phosphosugar isomerase protein